MAKLTLTDVASGYQTVAADNANNALIEAALENTLSRDGTGPNTMSANIDMNGYALLNGTAASPADLNFSYGGNWATSTAYLVNALVSVLVSDDVHNGGSAYICVTAHTSGTFATDLSATKWRLFAARGRSGADAPTGTVTGTNAIVGTSAVVPLLAYAVGTTWTFVAAATNTGAVTINIDGLGIKSITKNGTTALVAGDILIGAEVTLFYDGTQYQDTGLRQPDDLTVPDKLVVTGTTTLGVTGANFPGSTSGTATLVAPAVAGTPTLTLPATTDTLVGKATTDTLTNKTLTDCLGFPGKNALINGGFTVNQRVYVSGATLASTAYGHDRWKAGSGGGDYSFTQLNSDTTVTIAAGKTLIQVVEDKNVQGTSYVLSWTGTAQARYAVNSATPTGSYAASPVLITGQTAGTTMSVEFNAGTLGKAQLEVGAVATAFEIRSVGTELALCQRYLPAFPYAGQGTLGLAQCYAATQTDLILFFPVFTRVAPTGLTVSGANHISMGTASGGSSVSTSILFAKASVSGMFVRVNTGGLLASGNASAAFFNNTAGLLLMTGCEL